MVRREPDGDDATEVTIAYVRQLERRLADLEAFVAGKLPHDHDARYVNEAGDTMTSTLNFDADVMVSRVGGNQPQARGINPGDSTERVEFRGADDSLGGKFRVFTNGFTREFEFAVRDKGGGGSAGISAQVDPQGNWSFLEDLTVSGSKNAEIPDPDDPTRAFRFAAVEADEPGLLIHRRTITIPEGNGGEATVDLPEHWSRIARDGDAMVTPLNDTRDQAPAAAAVDLTVPEVTVRGKPGDYRVWVAAARADAGVAGWTHEVEVTPDDEDV